MSNPKVFWRKLHEFKFKQWLHEDSKRIVADEEQQAQFKRFLQHMHILQRNRFSPVKSEFFIENMKQMLETDPDPEFKLSAYEREAFKLKDSDHKKAVDELKNSLQERFQKGVEVFSP